MSKEALSSLRAGRFMAAATFLFASTGAVFGQVVIVPPQPVVGSSNPVTAEPGVVRPSTKPCVVTLLQNQEFADFNNKPMTYTPPAVCPGPWAKVVFTADFTVTAGRQFDRTAAFYLGHANIYYGTTAEPRSALSPSWHVERDVTDLSAIFKSAQTGEADLGNFVGESGGVNYTGIIYGNAALEFYPASWRDPAPKVPDVVVPVNGSGGNAGTLNTTTDEITQTLNLPTNVEKVYLDVIAQSQSNDEFWYLCVPNAVAGELETCGNTAFRETEVTIDGKAAGVAPVYPWIYTGGIDPYLWEPITGVQTLDFKPYRVDLTPFAGLLSDGSTHTVAVSVYNADSYFLATANLLAFTDHGSKVVTGGVISNSLSAAPTPVVTQNLTTDSSGTTTGTVDVGSNRKFAIRGYVDTSHGRVDTTVEQTVNFLSAQTFDVGATVEIQNLVQTSTVDSLTTTRDGFLVTTESKQFSYPLTLEYSFVINPDGTAAQTVTSDQKNLLTETTALNGFKLFGRNVNEEVNSTDTLNFDSSFNLISTTGSATTGSYKAKDSLGDCYSRTLTAASQKLTSVSDGSGCHESHGW